MRRSALLHFTAQYNGTKKRRKPEKTKKRRISVRRSGLSVSLIFFAALSRIPFFRRQPRAENLFFPERPEFIEQKIAGYCNHKHKQRAQQFGNTAYIDQQIEQSVIEENSGEGIGAVGFEYAAPAPPAVLKDKPVVPEIGVGGAYHKGYKAAYYIMNLQKHKNGVGDIRNHGIHKSHNTEPEQLLCRFKSFRRNLYL